MEKTEWRGERGGVGGEIKEGDYRRTAGLWVMGWHQGQSGGEKNQLVTFNDMFSVEASLCLCSVTGGKEVHVKGVSRQASAHVAAQTHNSHECHRILKHTKTTACTTNYQQIAEENYTHLTLRSVPAAQEQTVRCVCAVGRHKAYCHRPLYWGFANELPASTALAIYCRRCTFETASSRCQILVLNLINAILYSIFILHDIN